MAKSPTTKREPRTAAATPTADVPSIAPETPSADIPDTAEPGSATATPAELAQLAEGDTIRMLTGQEGPTISRVRGQLLAIGADLDAAEAQRLIDADFAERA